MKFLISGNDVLSEGCITIINTKNKSLNIFTSSGGLIVLCCVLITLGLGGYLYHVKLFDLNLYRCVSLPLPTSSSGGKLLIFV